MTSGATRIEFRGVDRTNYRAMLALEVHPTQETFVASPGKSLANCLVRAFGDEFEHIPHVICAADEVVGYVTIACNPSSKDDYWIDDILIDVSQQGKGYGRIAVEMTLRMILARYPQCAAIRLTCFTSNHGAARIYENLGFRKTGKLHEEFGEPEYALTGTALDAFR
jgi:diamine N-acetyltransferase